MRQTNPLQTPQGTAYLIGGTQSAAPDARPALVFIHGVGLNKAVWRAQLDAFGDQHRVISYDMLGHGDSRLPAARPTLHDYASQLDELLSHLNIEQAHIIGHSMGALISIEFALSYAHRTCSVVAMNIVYQRNPAQRKAVRDRAAEVLRSGQILGIEQALQRWFENETGVDSGQKINRIRQWMQQADATGYGRSYQLFASSDVAFTGRLNQLAKPVLYLTGSKDRNSTPAMSQKMAMGRPQGQALVLENEAHMMAYIHPDAINAVIRQFLDEPIAEESA